MRLAVHLSTCKREKDSHNHQFHTIIKIHTSSFQFCRIRACRLLGHFNWILSSSSGLYHSFVCYRRVLQIRCRRDKLPKSFSGLHYPAASSFLLRAPISPIAFSIFFQIAVLRPLPSPSSSAFCCHSFFFALVSSTHTCISASSLPSLTCSSTSSFYFSSLMP